MRKNKEEKKEVKSESGIKTKAITVLLGLSFFCVFSFLLIIIFDRGLPSNNENNNKPKEQENPIEKNNTAGLKDADGKDISIDYNDLEKELFEAARNNEKIILSHCTNCDEIDYSNVDNSLCNKIDLPKSSINKVIEKLKSAPKVDYLPTSKVCSIYTYSIGDKITIFESDDKKSLLVGINGQGYAYSYDESVIEFFEDLMKPVEEESMDSPSIVALIDKIEKYYLDSFYNEETNITFTNTPSNSQLYLAHLYNINILLDKGDEAITDTVTKEMMDNYFMEVYGYKPTFYKDIICQVEKDILYKYVDDKYVYNDNHNGHDYYGSGFLSYYVTDAIIKGDLYTIDILFLRGNKADGYDVNGIDVTDKVSSSVPDYEDKLVQYFSEHHEEFINGDKYRYVFEKEGSNFYLKSFSIVK